MKRKQLIGALVLSVLAGAAAAQQPQTQPQESLYEVKDGRLVPRGQALPPGRWRPAGLGREQTKQPAPGRYRSEAYALRVQVPVPHSDSIAVVSPGPSRDEQPRQPLPAVQLVPDEPRKKP